MNRLAFIGAFLAAAATKLRAQTRIAMDQIAFPSAGTGPRVLMIMPDGTHRDVALGRGLALLEEGGMKTLNVVAALNNPAMQVMISEPDGKSWRIPTPYENPCIYRNGLLQYPGDDYTLEPSGVVRPKLSAATDRWRAR